MPLFNLRDATVKFSDGTGTPLTLTVKIGEGSLSYSEKKNIEYRRNRGVLSDVREGDDEPVDVSMDFNWAFITGNSADPEGATSIEDALKKVGGAAAWISSDSDLCNPYAVDIIVTFTPVCSATEKETITLADFRYESLDHNANDATISCSGKCNITKATLLRQSQ